MPCIFFEGCMAAMKILKLVMNVKIHLVYCFETHVCTHLPSIGQTTDALIDMSG